jgi:Fe-S cluster assembly ATP-binding protein
MLTIKNLKVKIKNKSILNGVNLKVGKAETHVIMGPNGSGKSTLSQTLFSHPSYTIESGKITFNGKNITGLSTDKIAKLGMLMAFQYPQTIPGVSVTNLLKIASRNIKNENARLEQGREASRNKDRAILPERSPGAKANPQKAKEVNIGAFAEMVKKKAKAMVLPEEFLTRSLNEGFSGGEKKKAEVLQLAVLRPKLAVFDETDSGLDVDALRIVAKQINELKKQGTSILLITHYQRILKYVKPDFVHVMKTGRIVQSGGKNLAEQIEKEGYSNLENLPLPKAWGGTKGEV